MDKRETDTHTSTIESNGSLINKLDHREPIMGNGSKLEEISPFLQWRKHFMTMFCTYSNVREMGIKNSRYLVGKG